MPENENNKMNLNDLFSKQQEADKRQHNADKNLQETPKETAKGVELLKQEAERRRKENIQRQQDTANQASASSHPGSYWESDGYKKQLKTIKEYQDNLSQASPAEQRTKTVTQRTPRIRSRNLILLSTLIGASVLALLAYQIWNDNNDTNENSMVLSTPIKGENSNFKPTPSSNQNNTAPISDSGNSIPVTDPGNKTMRVSAQEKTSNDVVPVSGNNNIKHVTSSQADSEEAIKKLQYVVQSKAFIYTEPKASSRTSKAIVPSKSMTPFNGLSEKNGYVYVVFSQGNNNHEGWVKKQTLKPIITVFNSGNGKD